MRSFNVQNRKNTSFGFKKIIQRTTRKSKEEMKNGNQVEDRGRETLEEKIIGMRSDGRSDSLFIPDDHEYCIREA